MADAELQAHREWLGYVQPIGVVVSPPALLAAQAYVNRNVAPLQQLLLDVVEDDRSDGSSISDLPKFLSHVLRWDDRDLLDPPAELERALPEYGEVLRATYVVQEVEASGQSDPWLMLINVLPIGSDFDTTGSADERGWQASPEAKFERLLRETQIPIGLLTNGTHVRLIYAPRGETSGHLTFGIAAMTEVAGRPILAALDMLLGAERLFTLPRQQRLPALLTDSRRYQNDVSTRLAGQVLAALYELLRGFQAADDHSNGQLLRHVRDQNPDLVYEGLLTVLLRLVFLLYSEDRDLMPDADFYTVHYSVGGLFDRLRADSERYPDTMDLRYGAWAQLLSLFRMVYDGARFGGMHLPPRYGHLFDPDRFPFLEGRPDGPRVLGDRIDAPFVSDGVVWRVLQNLLVLDGERLSYRSLDVEQIGSVYETMMGFRLEIASGHSIAMKPGKPHGPPITINLDELLTIATSKRTQWVREQAEQTLTEKESAALASATTVVEIEAAIARKIDRRATPNVVPVGTMILQPNEQRRRSGSFYTPRSLTEPIVRATLSPVLVRLGDNPAPEALLDIRICDPAMGSGAFLVEACRQLADKLVDAWHANDSLPSIPPDSDELLYARRLVAHRCLYGVDRNPIAVDLAKLSLWLATLARDHAFTFLDHSLRVGDSLVGVTPDEIVAFHWAPTRDKDYLTRSLLRGQLDEAEVLRAQIREAGEDVDVRNLRNLLRESDDALSDLRLLGDLVVLAFFSGANARGRQTRRDELAQQVWAWRRGGHAIELRRLTADMREDRQVMPFHWNIEFPEIFDRENPGFDAIVGNPPFMGGKDISGALSRQYLDWLHEMFPSSSGQVDLVTFFLRRAYDLIRRQGTLGLVTTKSIAQGDSRRAGLMHICKNHGVLFNVVKRIPWPGAAAVTVSVVCLAKELEPGPLTLDGAIVDRISPYLVPGSLIDEPSRLMANRNKAFMGYYNYGEGFLFDDEGANCEAISRMEELTAKDPMNRERIFPFIGGDEFLESPTVHIRRYVIDFADLSEQEARHWPELFAILENRVKAERAKCNRERLRTRWWQFGEIRPGLRRATKGMSRLLMHPFTSKHLAFGFVPAKVYIASPHYAIVLESFAAFGVLQSRIHEIWARFFASSLEDRLRYTASDCFETFPLPEGLEEKPLLEARGQAYYQFRTEMMCTNNEGLTKTYNRFHDPNDRSPDTEKLRELHDAMDRAVIDSYGWNDIQLSCEFLLDYEEDENQHAGNERRRPWRFRWPDKVRDEVLARLLALNVERAQADRLQGAEKSSVGSRGRSKAGAASAGQLFEEA